MINHFSHRHPLIQYKVDHHDHQDHDKKDDEDDQIICSGCELELLPNSSAYKCEKSGCEFHLHEMCYELPREIRHGSHIQHPLSLLFVPPPSFSCAGCGGSGTAFIYSCRSCRFGLHVQCSALPDSVEREDRHGHPLRLVFSSPEKRVEEVEHACGICGDGFDEGCWGYSCAKECGFGAHLECAVNEEDEELVQFEEEEEESSHLGVDLSVVIENQKAIVV